MPDFHAHLRYPEHRNLLRRSVNEGGRSWISTRDSYLLLEIPSIFFVDKDEIEVVTCAEFLVHISESRSQVKPSEKQSYRDRFP